MRNTRLSGHGLLYEGKTYTGLRGGEGKALKRAEHKPAMRAKEER